MSIDAGLGYDFESVAADLLKQLPAGSIVDSQVAFGTDTPYGEGRSMNVNGGFIRCALANQSVTGWQSDFLRFHPGNSGIIMQWLDGATVQCNLYYDSADRKLKFRRGTTVLVDSGTNALPSTATWVHMKVKCTVHNSTGAIHVKVNGVDWIPLTGSLDSAQSANNYATLICWGSDSFRSDYDNTTVIVTTGSAPTDLTTNNIRYYPRKVNGAGSSAQFTPSAGSNFQNVDESVQNGDTDYNQSNTAGHVDMFTVEDLPASGIGTIHFVSIITQAKRVDAGDTNIQIGVNVGGGSDDFGPSVALSASYENQVRRMDTKPAGGAWSVSDFNGIQMGYKKP